MVKQWIKQNYILMIAFLVPASLLVLLYSLRGVYPFGKNSVLVLDLNAQYVYYYEAFRDTFYDGKSLLYSFSRTLGGEMIGIFAYYLASPFSLILLIFPKEAITEAIYCMIVLKIGSAAATFGFYLQKARGAKPMNILIFSLLYSMMSYVIVETMNPMWLDGLILLPIIMFCVERLVSRNKYIGLIISLSLLFISNYYIGYMTGIYAFIYFLYTLFGRSRISGFRHIAKKFLLFIGSFLLSVGLSLWLLLPTYYSLKMGKFDFTSPNFDPIQKLDVFDVLIKMLPMTYDSVNYPGLPFIFCGTIILLLIIYYFASKTIPSKEKLASGSMIALFIICFMVSTIDIALHGFQAPNWLNYRYSFIFSFFLLCLSYEAFTRLQSIHPHVMIRAFIGNLVIVAILGRMGYEFIKPEVNLWTAYFCLIAYTILLYLLRKSPYRRSVQILIYLFVAAEMFFNATAMVEGADKEVLYSTRDSYREFIDALVPAFETITDGDKSFYRSETIHKRTVNDPMALDINGISHSSSTLNSKVIHLMFQLGFSSREHWTKYKGGTPVTDSVLGMKYIVSELPINTLYTPVYSDAKYKVYQNPYVLPLAFVVDDRYRLLKMDSTDPFVNQNKLLSTLTGSSYTEYFKLVPIEEIRFENMNSTQQEDTVSYSAITPGLNAHIEYILESCKNNEMYMYLYSQYPRKVNLWKDHEFLDTFFDNESVCIMPLGVNSNQETISLITTPTEDEYFLSSNMFYYLDTDLFKEAIAKIQSQQITIEKKRENHIVIQAIGREQSVLFTSIPYEKGWQVRINGKRVPTFETMDALLAVELYEGLQVIDLQFIPEGLYPGIIMSLIALRIFIMVYIKSKTVPVD